jgi:hypothetical protein
MFIRVLRPGEQKEILVNLNSVWKIEVTYAIPKEKTLFPTMLDEGKRNPEAVRIYTVYAGGEVIKLMGAPDDPVVKPLEEIYKNAIKA